MSDDFSQCLVLNTRMAARAVTRRYDRRLRPLGITAAQFTILGTIARQTDCSVTALAHSIAMERSTLSRNIDLLTQKGLVRRRDADTGQGQVCALTEAGHAMLAAALPEWRKMQDEMRTSFAEGDLKPMVEILRKLASF